MTLADIVVNNKFHLVDLQENGLAVDVHTGEEYDDFSIFMSYGTNDYNRLFYTQDHIVEDYSEHIANTRQEYLIRRQTEIVKNVKSSELKESDTYRGVQRINGLLSRDICEKLNDYINEEFDNGRLKPIGSLTYAKNRYDMALEKEGIVSDVMNTLSIKNIKEVAVIISEPGATMQPFHPDFYDTDLHTCFIALQDITEDMGPTQLIPNTNDEETNKRYDDEKRIGYPLKNPNVLGVMNCGDALIYDVRTIHRGTENKSSKRRNLFYVTYASPAICAR